MRGNFENHSQKLEANGPEEIFACIIHMTDRKTSFFINPSIA